MAARTDDDPSFLIKHPMKTQLAALGLGAVGGALTRNESTPVTLAALLGPIGLVQLLRRMELKRIQGNYDEKDRKRLRDIDEEELFHAGASGLGGSSQLGAVNAYETMRKRKYQNLGSLAEAGDALQLASASFGPAGYLGAVPVTSAIDKRDAARMLDKAADFADQRNSPTIPLYLLAGLLGSAGLGGSQVWAKKEMGNTKPLGRKNWDKLIGDISGGSPLLQETTGAGNAFFYKPQTEMEAIRHLQSASGGSFDPERTRKVQKLLRHGTIVADSDAGAPTIAHEAGHAKIENTPGVLRALQRHVYPHSGWIAPMSGVGSLAAGLASGGALKGALLGTGIGAITGAGTLGPEAGASYRAINHLGGAESKKDLASALSTYLAFGVLPSTLAGAAGGWISGRRKKDDDGKEIEKEANLRNIAKALNTIKTQKMSGNLADELTKGMFGRTSTAVRRGFYNNKQVRELGINARTPYNRVTELLKQLDTKPAPPPMMPLAPPPIQQTFDFLKQSRYGGAARALGLVRNLFNSAGLSQSPLFGK